ncbi:MAG: single-stranded-DNA-specific exonuclease RecJ [Treponema sp.]|nr:single-stranded-DNA-specific exonuclease RecJ [Candidatus Treponema merdequi]
MSTWIKKDITKDQVYDLTQKFSLDPLTASIFARRNILNSSDIMFYLEEDLRFLHNPFLFNQMEDAVDRILDAKDEGEKVLIFGDRDVDGITSTTILYEYLKSIGMDVQFKVPTGDEAYGMNIETIDEFAKNYGTLIITVDCGIANAEEVKYASSLGIDVIITDHHNVPEKIPEPAIIINPKMPDSNYPFKEISGCAVAFKLIQALRFSETELYKQDICLLNASENENSFSLDCVKLHNNVEKERFSLRDISEHISISGTKLESFLKGQQIFTWDDKKVKEILKSIFGNSVEFNTFDLRPEAAKIIPQLSSLSLEQLNSKSKIARYSEKKQDLMDGFVNIFITYINQKSLEAFPNRQNLENNELQLVALAALADVMPLQNENRIFVKHGLKMINSQKTRRGLTELLSALNMYTKKITATDLAWTVIPAINATGRLGSPELGIKLLMEEDAAKRTQIADEIISLNTERKSLVNTAQEFVSFNAEMSYQKYRKFCFIIEKRIHRGVIGLISARLSQKYQVPAITVTFTDDDTAVGSMRSCRGLDCTEFLSNFGDLFINYGGHNKAAGFSMTKQNLEIFQSNLEKFIQQIELDESTEDIINVDAELPASYINPDLFKIIDLFEPYGETNSTLKFMTKQIKILSYQVVGKSEKQHLKLILETENHKIPVMYWNAAEKINKDFFTGDQVDLVYTVERNIFNGMENLQLVALEVKK